MYVRRMLAFLVIGPCLAWVGMVSSTHAAGLRAGASAVDVSPRKFPVLINGGFLQAQTGQVRAPLFARALVLDEGATRLALVVVDSCMMPRELIDRAKERASKATGIATDRMLISATHTHSAPAAMGALGCAPDGNYVELLPGLIAQAIEEAAARLEPARVGWGSSFEPEHTHCRRWIRRPDRMIVDPFGQPTGRAHMHPGHQNPDAITPSGPVDPQLSVLAVQRPNGEPIALLANYSMHYYGDEPASPDYFGRFARELESRLGGSQSPSKCVVMMSQGTSGDQQWMDYAAPLPNAICRRTRSPWSTRPSGSTSRSGFQDSAALAMSEKIIPLKRRVPDAERLAWARPIVAALNGQRAFDSRVYAREAVYLHDEPVRELKLQAIRIGDLGLAAIPDEVYALTGLKIKARSPLAATFTIELANGSEGYIPPPEQHALGGYTTWPARTAALEVSAETTITATIIELLEQVAKRPRRVESTPGDAYFRAILEARPWSFWTLDEMDGTVAHDATDRHHHARLDPGFALYLDGRGEPATARSAGSRSVYLAGGRIVLDGVPLQPATVEFWFWSGLTGDAREAPSRLVSLGEPLVIVLGGSGRAPGRLLVTRPTGESIASGTTEVEPKRWHHLAVSVDGSRISVDLDGHREVAEKELPFPLPTTGRLQLGGTDPRGPGFDGKIDDLALFDRVLTPAELKAHVAAGQRP
ncbi:MAG: LamG-like jellyroll fold domain-containing protein [Isosphaeraceae bacterium]